MEEEHVVEFCDQRDWSPLHQKAFDSVYVTDPASLLCYRTEQLGVCVSKGSIIID
jgi:hypothetical protein